MKLLVADTSGPVCGAAVLDGEKVLSEMTCQNRNTHSVSLMPMVEGCLERAGVRLSDLDALAAVTGPGSFTGIRIGVATVKALAHGSGKPCIGVDALETLAFGAGAGLFPGLICPLQDARAGQVYGAIFRQGERLMPNTPLALSEFLERAERMDEGPLLFCGDGAEAHRQRIAERMGDRALFAAGPFRYLRPSAAGILAQRKGEMTDYLHLKETYLRPPNAEKNKKLLEAMRRG